MRCTALFALTSLANSALHFANGGQADFRGAAGKIFNVLSARDISVNIKFAKLDYRAVARQLLVHGTKIDSV